MRTSAPSSPPLGGSVSSGPATAGFGSLCRITSGSPASSRSRPRLSSRSPCRAVTLRLPSARPECMTSTSRSTGSATVPARAKMACSERTVLPGMTALAATIIWPISWPPKTTGLVSDGTLGPRYEDSPVRSRTSEFRMG